MKKALIYSASVCLFSWAVYYGLIAIWGDVFKPGSAALTAFKSLYMFFPMIVALILQLITGERPSSTGLLRFKFSWVWLAAIGCVFAAVLLSIPISAVMPGVTLHYGPEQMISMNGLNGHAADAVMAEFDKMPALVMLFGTLFSGVLAGCTVNAVFAFGEEYGWRNYMVHALKGEQFWKAALLIGFVWGIWHAPLVLAGHNYPQHPVAGVGMMCVLCILLSIIELYFTVKTGSVFVAAVIHGCINAIGAVVVVFVMGGDDLSIGLTGAAGFVSMYLVIAAIYAYDRLKGENIMTSRL